MKWEDRERKREYHIWLKKILKDFYKEYSKKLIHHNETFKIYSLKRHSRKFIEYEPDFAFEIKAGKRGCEYIVFEFLDSECAEGIMADISECVIMYNCRVLLFLCKEAEKHKQADEIKEVFITRFNKLKKEKKDILDIIIIHIPLHHNEKSTKKLIYKEIKKLLPLPKPILD